MKKYIFVVLFCSISACSHQQKATTATTDICCDAQDNCSPAPKAPGVCPADTITSTCDADNNCEDQ